MPGVTSHRIARCTCGALHLRVTGDPLHVHACSCSECQRYSGSVTSWSARFPEDAVAITGSYSKHFHCPARLDRYRGFCPGCGTGKFFSSGAGFPGTIAITGGAFADPGFPPPEFLLYWANCPQWSGVPEGITLHLQND